jgi:predicted transcriptional regulator
MAKKTSTSFHLSDQTKDTLKVVSRRLRLSQAALIEFAVGEVARQHGITDEQIATEIAEMRSGSAG